MARLKQPLLKLKLKMLSFILSIAATLFARFFGKSTGDKAIDTLLDEKQKTIEAVKDANKTENRLASDNDFANSVQQRFERND